MKRRVLLVALLLVVAGAPAAEAGGSTWNFDQDRYEPGNTAFAWVPVAWEHNDDLGTPEDGPYRAWVVPGADELARPGGVPPDAIDVGPVEISPEPYTVGDTAFGPHHATVRFQVPDLPPGDYSLIHCNVPCTTTLGDITWGALRVAPGPPIAAADPSSETASATSEGPATNEDPATRSGAPEIDLDERLALDPARTERGPGMIPIVIVATVFTAAIAVVLGDLRRRRHLEQPD